MLLVLLIIFCTLIPRNEGFNNIFQKKNEEFTNGDMESAKISMKSDSNNYNAVNYNSYTEYSMFDISMNNLNPPPIYNPSGSSKNYVPDYEESVYLSKNIDKNAPLSVYSNT